MAQSVCGVLRRVAVALAFLTVCPAAVHAQAPRDLRPELEVQGRVHEISLSPAGVLWIGTMMGHAYRSDDGGKTWSEAAVPTRKMTPETFLGDNFDRVTFFDERRAMISGSLGEDNDRIFVTGDGGATWTPVQLPIQGFWAYDAQATPDGHAWIVGSSGAVLRSDDYGRTWKELGSPFDEEDRSMSVWFASPEKGVAGSLSSGTLAVTSDGGGTWRTFEAAGRDAVVAGCKETHDQRVVKARILGDRVLVAQCGGVFSSPLDAPRAWSRVTAGGKPLADFELGANGALIGVTAAGEVYELGADGKSVLLHASARPAMSLAVAGKHIALLDPTMKVTVFDGERWFSSRMFAKGTARSWPIAAMDRGPGDVLWGASEFFLYRSTDGAKTWDRIAELPVAAGGLALQSDGNVLLWDRHGWVGRWETAGGRFVDVPVLNGLDVVGSLRRSDLWLLYGGRQFDTAARVKVGQTFFSGQFAGSVDYGFVAASADGGRTWKIVDQWKDEGPQLAFLGDDGRLTLYSWLGAVRQGTITRDPLEARLRTLFGSNGADVPYVQRAFVLDLIDPSQGALGGWIHHVGDLLYRTRDGGRTWTGAESKTYPRVSILRLFDGTWIGFVPPSRLERLNGKAWEPFVEIPGQLRQLWIDSQGGLSIELKDGTVQVLDRGGAKMRSLSSLPAGSL